MDKPALTYHTNRILTASEIGGYMYCNRSWWLNKVGGQQPLNVTELALGELAHEEHGQEVQRAEQMNRGALLLIAAAVVLVVLWGILNVGL